MLTFSAAELKDEARLLCLQKSHYHFTKIENKHFIGNGKMEGFLNYILPPFVEEQSQISMNSIMLLNVSLSFFLSTVSLHLIRLPGNFAVFFSKYIKL